MPTTNKRLATDATAQRIATALEYFADRNPNPTLIEKTITENGIYDPINDNADGYGTVTVDIAGILVGTTDPDSSMGNDGDYYYKRKLIKEYGYTSNPSSYSGTTQTGYEFITKEAIAVSGLRARNRNTSGTLSLLLARLDGTILGQIDNVSANGAWTEAYFDTPIQLTAGEHYIVQAIKSNQGFLYQSKSSTAFNSKITGVQGRYGGLPGTTDSTYIYSADIIIASDNDIYTVTRQYYKSSGTWGVIG